MPPRHTKSEFASYLLPSWMAGRKPKLKIIQVTHTGELAIRFGRKAKHLIDSEDYGKIFKTRLQEDSQAAGRWETAQGGEHFAAGVVEFNPIAAVSLVIQQTVSVRGLKFVDPKRINRCRWFGFGPHQKHS